MAAEKIALVTGANRGLGFETTRQLSKKGIHVVMGARTQEKGEAAASKLKTEGLGVEPIELDVTNSGHIKKARQYLEKQFGRLDILVNNAAMAHAEEPLYGHSVETISPAALRATFDVNFFGMVELTQALLPLIKKSKAGRIVNVASILGSLTIHSQGDDFKPFAYDASKTAVNAFTVHLAAALKDTPVLVNSAHPGWVRTEMGGSDAPMEVEEGAKTAVFLATLEQKNGFSGKFIHQGEELPW